MCICAGAYEKYKRVPQVPQSRRSLESVDLQGFALRDFRKAGSRRSRRKEIFMSYKEEIMQIMPVPSELRCYYLSPDSESKTVYKPMCFALVKELDNDGEYFTSIKTMILSADGSFVDATQRPGFLRIAFDNKSAGKYPLSDKDKKMLGLK